MRKLSVFLLLSTVAFLMSCPVEQQNDKPQNGKLIVAVSNFAAANGGRLQAGVIDQSVPVATSLGSAPVIAGGNSSVQLYSFADWNLWIGTGGKSYMITIGIDMNLDGFLNTTGVDYMLTGGGYRNITINGNTTLTFTSTDFIFYP